jgi:hypothetical protein
MTLSAVELSLLLEAIDYLEAEFMTTGSDGHPEQLVLDALTVKLRKEHRAAKLEESAISDKQNKPAGKPDVADCDHEDTSV